MWTYRYRDIWTRGDKDSHRDREACIHEGRLQAFQSNLNLMRLHVIMNPTWSPLNVDGYDSDQELLQLISREAGQCLQGPALLRRTEKILVMTRAP